MILEKNVSPIFLSQTLKEFWDTTPFLVSKAYFICKTDVSSAVVNVWAGEVKSLIPSFIFHKGIVGIGSMGSAKPINFERRGLEPINF